MKPIQTVIIGDGAVGAFLAVLLVTHTEVTLISRSESTAPPALALTGHIQQQTTKVRCLHADDAEALRALASANFVFICVKAHQFSSAELLFRAIPRTAPTVLVQNGLGILERAYHAGLPRAVSAIRMLCRFGVYRETPYSVRLAGPYAATLAPDISIAHDLSAQLLDPAGFSIDFEQSVAKAEWQKALINLFVNPVCTVLNQSNAAVLEDDAAQEVAMSLVDEALQVARAEGVTLERCSREQLVRVVEPFSANINSHLADLRAGRTSDMEVLLGEVEVRAARYGLAVPVSSTMYRLWKSLSITAGAT